MTRRPARRRRWVVAAVLVLYTAAVAATLHARTASSRPRVPSPAGRSTVYVMGASIAQGYRAGDGWPQLAADDGQLRSRLRLVNGSVSATRLLLDAPGLPSYLTREGRMLADHAATTIVLTDLINDIQNVPHQYDPDAIVAGVRTFVTRAHAHNVRVLVTTIAPYGGYAYSTRQSFSPSGERCRRAVNAALRSGHLVDGAIDFDRLLADPGRPDRLDPAFDSGDHLHPNDAGQHAMADAAELQLLAGRR